MKRTWKDMVRVASVAILGLGAMGMTAHQMIPHTHVHRPSDTEFGFGPRQSANGLYTATIETDRALAIGPMLSIRIAVQDAQRQSVDSAVITISGGMPQHGHGLPTQPRVTRMLGDGRYQVDGLKFSMGGWWVLTFQIDGSRGTDSVSFNLNL